MQLVPKIIPEVRSQTLPIPASGPEIIALDVGGMKMCRLRGGCGNASYCQQPGVIAASVNLAVEVATVECQPGTVDAAALAKKLTDNGFPSQSRCGENLLEVEAAAVERRKQEIQQQIRQLTIALILIILSGLGHFLGAKAPILSNIWLHWGLCTLALLLPGRQIVVDGFRSLLRNAPNMNTLVALGAVTAYTASNAALLFPQMGWECFFDEPVMLLGFILLGKTLEQQARRRAASALQSLIALQPSTARLVDFKMPDLDVNHAENAPNSPANSPYIEIPADRVRVGEWLQVLPGDKFPVDGEVCQGKTTVDESMLTGESIPVLKQNGDAVAAGTINKSGAIVMRATRTGKETTVAQIVALVEAAQTRKAPIQKLADTAAGYFAYAVMSLSALTFLFWYFAGTRIWPSVLLDGGANMAHAAMNMGHQFPTAMTAQSPLLLSLKLAIAVLVIACPCALGLATPTAILVGSGIGAQRGLLIRGGDVLERVYQLDTVVFDKTGTLTNGLPVLTDYLVLDNSGIEEVADVELSQSQANKPEKLRLPNSKLLQIAAAVERGACHPIAEAILQEASKQGLPLLEAEDFFTEPGLGVSAVVAGRRAVVGNADWLRQQGIPVAADLSASLVGKTVVCVAWDGLLLGAVGLKDEVRSDAKAAIDRLRAMGLRVMMLTGDTASAAAETALQLDLTGAEVLAGVRPEGKLEAIATLQAQGCKVAMVGDGINDAAALAQADVGIGMHCGTDVAVETAQIVLVRNALMDVAESIELGRATFGKIRQNLFWAFSYNILGIPVAAGLLLPVFGILLSPATAGAFMAFSSVSVVTNSLLLRRSFRA